mmetsp:Transcript_43940/g.103956  ORF Transcript_43940/g.103956 Transcript_43940/m.103956 type:complete len:350 (-) Transcript_43940:122-1171(-)
MLEDLAFSVGRQGVLGDVKVVVPPAARPGKRRPGLIKGSGQTVLSPLGSSGECQLQEPSMKESYLSKARPRSLGLQDSLSGWQAPEPRMAEALDGTSDAEVARLHAMIAELSAQCHRQAKELLDHRSQATTSGSDVCRHEEELRQRATSSTSPARAPPSATHAEVQTDETELMSIYREQLDAMHKEVAMKGRELRKVQETVHTLRAELNQQKRLADQYKDQVDTLEAQLVGATQAQQRAEDEKAMAQWRLRTAEGAARGERSCTPGPASARVMKAWSEASCSPADGAFHGSAGARPASAIGRSGTFVLDGRLATEDSGGSEDDSDESEGEEITIFQRPATISRNMVGGA